LQLLSGLLPKLYQSVLAECQENMQLQENMLQLHLRASLFCLVLRVNVIYYIKFFGGFSGDSFVSAGIGHKDI
jgi:hypothetical protein